jgi:hypothetical protein
MNWINALEILPGIHYSWVIVRTVNKDKTIFYFMASFSNGKWNYFDNDKDYENNMRVTHWCIPDTVISRDDFDSYGE